MNKKPIGQTLSQKESEGKIEATYQYLSETDTGDYLQAKLKKKVDSPDKIRLVLGRYGKKNPDDFKTRNRSNDSDFAYKYTCGVELKSKELQNLLSFLEESKNNTFLPHPEEKTIYQKITNEESKILELLKINPSLIKNLNLDQLEYAKNEYDIRSLQVDKFKEMLDNTNLIENDWQDFFEKNPHILQACIPTFYQFFRGKYYARGQDYSGKGAKITDLSFIDSLNSISFIEIKMPTTPLLKGTYRDVNKISIDLSGSVSQILSQKHEHYLKCDTKSNPTQFYNSPCFIIIGNTSELDNEEKKKSFDLFRYSLSNINIITFDEIYKRLVDLVEIIKIDNSKYDIDKYGI